MLDKNDKEIYENDIVRYDDTPYNAYGRIKKGIIVYYRGTDEVKKLMLKVIEEVTNDRNHSTSFIIDNEIIYKYLNDF